MNLAVIESMRHKGIARGLGHTAAGDGAGTIGDARRA